MGDSGFKVITHYKFMSFWGEYKPTLRRANWYSANRSEDNMIDYIDNKMRLKNNRTEVETDKTS